MSSEARDNIIAAMEKATGTLLSLEIEADAVIAHFWQRADDPATVNRAAEWIARDRDNGNDELLTAERVIRTILTALIGPGPDTEQEREG